MDVDPTATSLNSREFNGVLADWKRKVEAFQISRAATVQTRAKAEPESLSIGELIRGLRLKTMWALLVALVSLLTGSFFLGRYVGATMEKLSPGSKEAKIETFRPVLPLRSCLSENRSLDQVALLHSQ